MHDKTNHKMRVALAAGALLALGLAGCNREKAQMDTEPAAAATMATEPADTMPPPSTYVPPSSTTMMPPAGSTMMPPADTTMPGTTGEVPPMDDDRTAGRPERHPDAAGQRRRGRAPDALIARHQFKQQPFDGGLEPPSFCPASGHSTTSVAMRNSKYGLPSCVMRIVLGQRIPFVDKAPSKSNRCSTRPAPSAAGTVSSSLTRAAFASK